MRWLHTLVLVAVLLTLPTLALAAPRQVSLGEYQGLLRQASERLEVAERAASSDIRQATADIAATRSLLADGFVVETPAGTVHVDTTAILAQLAKADPATDAGRRELGKAVAHLQAQVQAASTLNTATLREVPGARADLERALDSSKAKTRWLDWLAGWLRGLFSRTKVDPETLGTSAQANGRLLLVIGLAIGAVGAFLLGRSLLSLWGHGGGAEAALLTGKATRPDRPLTPEEMWQLADRHGAEGDYKEGLRIAHLALLKRFDQLGLLRYVPAQTNREHEAMLRRQQPGMALTMHNLNDLVEAKLYSGHGASADDFARGQSLATQLWREGDAVSRRAQEPTGASSSESSP